MAQTEHLLRWFQGFQAFVQSREEFRPLANVTAVPPDKAGSPEAHRLAHVNASLHTLYSPQAEEIAIRAVDAYAREALGVVDPAVKPSAEAERHVKEMRRRGFSFMPDLAPEKIAAMKDYLGTQPLYERTTGRDRTPIAFEEAEERFNLAHFDEVDIVNCPHLLEIATDPLHMGIAREFLGTVPQVITVAAWWSFAKAEQARSAQLFHLDLDDYRFFKLFFYLTDVDEEAGPHVFVPTTNRHDTLVLARRASASPQDFDAWMGTLRKTDEDVMAVFGIDPVHLTGKAGTSFIANTRGIHKGLLPKSKNRLICQVAYGVTPQRIAETLPVTLSPESTPNLPDDFLTPPMDYVLQLYLRGEDKT